MPVGVPGSNSRGRGGKFKKFSRGGGKHFSRDLQPVDAEGNHVSMWSEEVQAKDSDDEEEEEEEDSDEEEEPAEGSGEGNREDRKALKKARKEAAIAKQRSKTVEVGDLPSSDEESDDDMPANPNHSTASRKQAEASKVATVDDITTGVKKLPANRREREAAEAAAAKERYMKLHAQGKTDESKADLARLQLIREQRAAEAARKQAEKEEKEEQDRARRTEIEAREAKKRALAAGPKKSSKKK